MKPPIHRHISTVWFGPIRNVDIVLYTYVRTPLNGVPYSEDVRVYTGLYEVMNLLNTELGGSWTLVWDTMF